MPNTACATDPDTTASTTPGISSRRRAAGPARLKTAQSSSSPDRRKMMARAPWRIFDFQAVGSARVSQGTGMLIKATPDRSMPRRGWRPVNAMRAPPS